MLLSEIKERTPQRDNFGGDNHLLIDRVIEALREVIDTGGCDLDDMDWDDFTEEAESFAYSEAGIAADWALGEGSCESPTSGWS